MLFIVQLYPNNHVQPTGTSSMVGNKKVLTRTVFSTQPPKPNSKQRVLTIQVPPSILQNNQLQKILTNPIINSTVGLPISIANNILQQHVNAALGIKPQPIEQVVILNSVIQGDAALIEDNDVDTNIPESTQQSDNIVKSNRKKSKIELKQYDGGNDQDEDKQKMENTADPKDDEEKSLNSDDDIDEDDDFSDTNNVIICQYEKINKIRNKWTMHLKEGIMNLNGKEYVFHKAKGDTKW